MLEVFIVIYYSYNAYFSIETALNYAFDSCVLQYKRY